MSLGPRLDLRQTQSLVMTPQLQQAIKLLALSNLELEAFIGDALAHGVLPGIAAALLLGLPGIMGAAAGALAMIGGVTLITSRSRLSSDTAIGLLFVSMLALGVVIVSRSSSFTGDLVTIDGAEALLSGQQFSGLVHQDRAAAKALLAGLRPKRS